MVGFKRFSKIIDNRNVTLVTNLSKSFGNYLVDINNNKYLDLYCNIASLPVGYNHPTLEKINFNSDSLKGLLIQRSALGVNPPIEWIDQVEQIHDNYAPKGLDFMFMGCGCGSGANENAFKAAFLHYAKLNFGELFMKERLNSVLKNKEPGAPKLSILSFEKGFHGRTLGCLSTTRSNPYHKLNIPAFEWPVAPFPQLKYPLEEYANRNKIEEERCLTAIRKIIKSDKNIAGAIIEPIQAEGGDRHASDYFFKELRTITKDANITFIVDEVQTGVGSTGKMWAHQHWSDENNLPDIVTFSKKMQIAGYFCKPEFRPDNPYQNFNTWLGDPFRIIITNKISEIIKEEKLIENVNNVGNYLLNNLKELEQKTRQIYNIRGRGTFISFDHKKPEELKNKLFENGVNSGLCGANSIRLRPSLIFSKKEADTFLNILELSLKLV